MSAKFSAPNQRRTARALGAFFLCRLATAANLLRQEHVQLAIETQPLSPHCTSSRQQNFLKQGSGMLTTQCKISARASSVPCIPSTAVHLGQKALGRMKENILSQPSVTYTSFPRPAPTSPTRTTFAKYLTRITHQAEQVSHSSCKISHL